MYLRDVPPGQRTFGTLSYNRRSRCWTIKGDPSVTEIAKRLFPGCSGRGRGVARFPAHRRVIADLNWLMMRYPLEIKETDIGRWEDALEEARLQEKQYGSTKKGIAPFYSDKYQKKTVLAGELFYPEVLKHHLNDLREWKNLVLTGVYGEKPVTEEEIDAWLEAYCEPLKPFIQDTSSYLMNALHDHKQILFEGQLGALRDLDFGIYPYTTSSNVLASYAPIGSGMPGVEIDRIIGVVKAYSSCVGTGPFVCELFGPEADRLRQIGGEFGHRTHRVGPIDLVATRYGVQIQAATEIALTKLDVLSKLDQIPLCVRYRYNGEETDTMPFPSVLDQCEPVIETMPGWQSDISGIRTWWDLPSEAQNYVKRIEDAIGVVIKWISVGPERHSIIRRG